MKSSNTFLSSACSRCGSPKKISRVWNQTVETFSGATEQVEISQIICTNEECQRKFDKNRVEEIAKNTARKLAKEEQDKLRKGNLAISLANARKNKTLTK